MVDEPRGIDFHKKRHGTGRTGFHMACVENHVEVVKIIAENSQKLGIDLNIQDSKGNSGLMDACASRYKEYKLPKVVDFLLANSEKYNINMDLENNGYKSARDMWPEKFFSKYYPNYFSYNCYP